MKKVKLIIVMLDHVNVIIQMVEEMFVFVVSRMLRIITGDAMIMIIITIFLLKPQ